MLDPVLEVVAPVVEAVVELVVALVEPVVLDVTLEVVDDVVVEPPPLPPSPELSSPQPRRPSALRERKDAYRILRYYCEGATMCPAIALAATTSGLAR